MSSASTRSAPADKPSAARRPIGGVLLRRLPWWAELVIAVVTYELYNAVQSLTSGSIPAADAHGRSIAHLERELHIWFEGSVNHFATDHRLVGLVGGYYYELAHVTVTLGVLAYLWRRRPDVYPVLRNTLLLLSIAALLVFWLWPVAPPRFVVGGLTDTLVRNNILGAAHVHEGLVNLYAAMPSLHVAWATWCAAAIVLTSRSRWRHLAWDYPLLTTLAVVATANHYILDAVAGATLTGVALAIVVTRSSRRWTSGETFPLRRTAVGRPGNKV
jgi:hypothetical protein